MHSNLLICCMFLNLRFLKKLNCAVDLMSIYCECTLTLQTHCRTWAEWWNHVVSEPVLTLPLDPSCMLFSSAHAPIKANLELLNTQIFSQGPLNVSWKTKIQGMCFEVFLFNIRRRNSRLGNLQWSSSSVKRDLKFASYRLRKFCPFNPVPFLCNYFETRLVQRFSIAIT